MIGNAHRHSPLKKYYPVAALLAALEAGWLVFVLYVLPWLSHS
jgi:hypothetical protein